jgi:hypothetical protein
VRDNYFIDRPYEGSDCIVNAMRGEEISYVGLNDYEAQCIDANLNYFRLPYPRFKRIFKKSESKLIPIMDFVSTLYVLQDGRLCIGYSIIR